MPDGVLIGRRWVILQGSTNIRIRVRVGAGTMG